MPGFNRNIVECKAIINAFAILYFLRFNRNIVECKVLSPPCSLQITLVLIETLWNVKRGQGTVDVIVVGSFNRNIVECKVTSLSSWNV